MSDDNEIEMTIIEYPINVEKKVLNIRWIKSKWGIFENAASDIGPCGVWYRHNEKNIWLPYVNNEFLFFFLKSYGYSLHFIKKVLILIPHFIHKVLQIFIRLSKKS